MFTFNSYLKLRYWLRERIILWGFGLFEGWSVGALESDWALERFSVRGFEGWRVVWEGSDRARARFTKQYLLYMIYS